MAALSRLDGIESLSLTAYADTVGSEAIRNLQFMGFRLFFTQAGSSFSTLISLTCSISLKSSIMLDGTVLSW